MPTTENKTTPVASVEPSLHRADDLLSTLADRVGARFAAATVFGKPVERDGVTVVPVAVARFGFGGGRAKDQDGAGAGAGGMVAPAGSPAGYIELKDGHSRFVPIVNPARMLALVSATILAGLLIVRPLVDAKRGPTLRRWRHDVSTAVASARSRGTT
jgi:uncharacterized spore protein YtfJ